MKSDDKACSICFENILSTGKLNSCEHDFHYKCIVRWAKISSNCPTCRTPFTEISHIKNGKIIKRIHIDEDYHTTEEDISNSDVEEWQAACGVCLSTSPEFLLACEGGFDCSKVVHSYCLPSGSDQSHWICDDCENETPESLASEEGSAIETESESSEVESDPDAEYSPDSRSPNRRTSERLSGRGSTRDLLELKSESENSFIEYDSDDFSDDRSYSEESVGPTRRSTRLSRRTFDRPESSYSSESQEAVRRLRPRQEVGRSPETTQPRQLRRLKRNNERNAGEEISLPAKRTRSRDESKEDWNRFVMGEVRKELERNRMAGVNTERIVKNLVALIGRSGRLHDINDSRTVQKIRTVIRNHIAGIVAA